MTASFVPSDDPVRESIRTDLSTNICVEAGAGTGKTTVLVDRIVEMLRRPGEAEVHQLAVITFTEKAAAELAARVRQRLEVNLESAQDDAERDRLDAALRGLNHAHIETIHAFATSLLRERPVEAGLSPAFEVLDEMPAQLAFDAAWSEWIGGQSAQDPPPEALVGVLGVDLDFRYVRDAAERLNRHRDVLPLPRPSPLDPGVHAWVDVLRDELDRYESTIAKSCNDPENVTCVEWVRMRRVLTEADTIASDGGALDRLAATTPLPNTFGGKQTDWSPMSNGRAAKDALKVVHAALMTARDAVRAHAVAELLFWLQNFIAYYDQQRRAAGTADFDDLLIWARDLVRDNTEVRRYFQLKYRRILVDEFQDTDPIQAEIIVRLCADGDGSGDWRTLSLRPGSLFVVGDPKQSIYRFRRADIGMYDDVIDGAFGGDRRHITQNFRSSRPIIDWVNRLFPSMFVGRHGVQSAYVSLDAHPEIEAGTDAVQLIQGSVSGRPIDLRRAEAQAIASVVTGAIAAAAWRVRDQHSGAMRAASWRDVCILIASRTDLEHYEDVFARAGMPYRHEGGRAYFLRQEVRDLAAILRAIDDPSDAVAAVAALRSPAFGCSDEDLFLHRSGGWRFDHRSLPADAAGPVADALRTLSGVASRRHSTPLPVLVRNVLDETRMVEFAMLKPQGEQAAANLLKVIDQARAFAAAQNSGLRGFARWLGAGVNRAGDPRATSPDETDASISEETDDVVRVLTVHASKGLEFPIVVFANMGTRRANTTNVIVNRTGGGTIEIRLGAKDNRYQTPGYANAETAEAEHRDAEEQRLLYVAATRARDRLVVPLIKLEAQDGNRDPCLNDWLRKGGAGMGEDETLIDREDLAPVTGDVPAFRIDDDGIDPAGVTDVIEQREGWMRDLDHLLADGGAGSRIHTASSLKEFDPAQDFFEGIRRGGALDVGTAVHAVIERVDLAKPGTIGLVARAVASEFGLGHRVDEIEELVSRALDSPVMHRARSSRRMLRETPFTVSLAGADAPLPGLAEGRIDLLFEEEGGLVIVDFKTDAVSAADAAVRAEAYRTQAMIYAWAANRATRMPVREVVFIFARPGVGHSVPVDDVFLGEATELLATP